MVQVVRGVLEDQRWSEQNRISRVALVVPVVLVVQEDQQVQVCHSLGYQVILALQGGLDVPAQTLLWAPLGLVSQVNLDALETLSPPCLLSLL